MAAENSEMWLLREMDSLWFYQIIIFPRKSLFVVPETSGTHLPASESTDYSSRNSSQISVLTCSQDDTSSQESDHDTKKYNRNGATMSHSSSTPTKSRKIGQSHYPKTRLEKTMSCKSLGELELEELKGFMDLGFDFNNEKASKRLMRLIPGLQRIDNVDRDIEDGGERNVTRRPYLSEAWDVKRADYDYDCSSLMKNMRLERACTDEDMKKRLKCWARAIASAIHHES